MTHLLAVIAAAVVFNNVSVIDVERESVRAAQTVIVDGDRIDVVQARSARDAKATSVAEVIDAGGAYLLPALWDMHVHPSRKEDLLLLLANGVGGARIMFGEPEHLAWRAEIALGRMPGPRLKVAGPIIEGTPPAALRNVIATSGRTIADTYAEGRVAVRRHVDAGFDYIKVYNNIPASAYRGLTAQARESGIAVVGHVPFEVGLDGALAAGQRSIEHMRGYVQRVVPETAPIRPGADLRSRTLAWRYADATLMEDLARRTAAAGVWHCPTLMTRLFTGPEADLARFLDAPESVFLAPEARKMLTNRANVPWLSNFSAEDFENAARGYDAKSRLLRALGAGGVSIIAGTDSAPWGYSLHMELERLVGAGFSPAEVLRMAITNPARFVGLDGVLGRIEPGYAADMVLLRSNPLDDIRNTRSIETVVHRGVVFERDTLDEWLDEVRRAYAE